MFHRSAKLPWNSKGTSFSRRKTAANGAYRFTGRITWDGTSHAQVTLRGWNFYLSSKSATTWPQVHFQRIKPHQERRGTTPAPVAWLFSAAGFILIIVMSVSDIHALTMKCVFGGYLCVIMLIVSIGKKHGWDSVINFLRMKRK